MVNANISQKHDNMDYIRNNFKLKYVNNDENECINNRLSRGS